MYRKGSIRRFIHRDPIKKIADSGPEAVEPTEEDTLEEISKEDRHSHLKHMNQYTSSLRKQAENKVRRSKRKKKVQEKE